MDGSMRLAIAGFGTETSTFNPELTTLDDFLAFKVLRGDEITTELQGVATVGGYLQAVASRPDIETIPIVTARSTAGGRMTLEAYEFFKDAIHDGLVEAGQIDGLALHLHGAASAEGIDDTEGPVIEMCREILGPSVPIVVTLDHHANITQRMIDGCDALVGYRTQPHDPLETGVASTELLIRLAEGVHATMAWRKIPLISHQEQYLTSKHPMKTWFDRARGMETESGVLSVSNFPMQPWLDVEEAGWATVAVTEGDQDAAERLVDELGDLAWSMREEFQRRDSVPTDEAVARAISADEGIVIISDTGDSVFGGAAGDSTVLLEAVLRLDSNASALIPMVDRGAVAQLAAAGEGASITLEVGGCTSTFYEPATVTGVVRKIASGAVDVGEARSRWGEVDMGTTAILDVGSVTLMISERRGLGGNVPGVYRHFNVEPTEYKIVVLKTASNFQFFAPMTSELIRANTPGPTQSDMKALEWLRVPRPMYPLDDIEDWRS
jgi:microcystin degradation protein MlrC